MQIDQTTIQDLSIFNGEEEFSVFHFLNCTQTNGGREWFRYFLNNPFSTTKKINETQQLLQKIIRIHEQWPVTISNGTIMVIERFYETAINSIPHRPGVLGAFMYKLTNASDFSVTKYTIIHYVDFLKGLKQLVSVLDDENIPEILDDLLSRIKQLLKRIEIQTFLQIDKTKPISITTILHLGFFIRNNFKQQTLELIEIFSKLDAYYGMAMACKKHQFVFPEIVETITPVLSVKQVYHPLLHTPVAYDVNLQQEKNFIFLTGANMAGKSTFIKAVGVAVYLAHVGMGVPAQHMRLSLFDGLLSNIHVMDNIVKGESYFFNEVQRIRKTIEKISDGKKWLILIDELFKGTNVQDAMKCSTTVIEGLRKMNNVLFVLSTHLYEIGAQLKQYENIQFKYFETSVEDDQLKFSYSLKDGISNDRLGYLILRKEGVVEMLEKL